MAVLAFGVLSLPALLPGCRRQVDRQDAGLESRDAGYDPETGNRFEGPLVFDDERMRTLDPSTLRAGTAPCRAPILGRIYHVSDGDTVQFEGMSEIVDISVRLIGVDTPEVGRDGASPECYANEAAAFTAQLTGHLVWLTFDAECTDRFERALAYLHVGAGDGDFWERQLLRRGYATVLTIGPNDTFASLFESDEAAASRNEVGIWASCR